MKLRIFEYFDRAIALAASDLTIKPGAPPAYRVNGHFLVSEDEDLAPQEVYDLLLPLLDTSQQDQLRKQFQVFHLFPYRSRSRVRCCFFRQRQGVAANFRFIPAIPPSIPELRLPEELEHLALRPRGLFLVTGPAGSGKTHTMAAMINSINRRCARHIISMENPVEFVHSHVQSVFTQIEVGKKIRTYQDALTNALREDPDVMMIGEMKDEKTVEMALIASETGHFVLSTLPTLGASKSIERIVSFFPPEKHDELRGQVATNLVGIFSQLLIPKENPSYLPSLAYELLIANPPIRKLIREKKYSQLNSQILMSRREGGITLKDSLGKLLADETADKTRIKSLIAEITE